MPLGTFRRRGLLGGRPPSFRSFGGCPFEAGPPRAFRPSRRRGLPRRLDALPPLLVCLRHLGLPAVRLSPSPRPPRRLSFPCASAPQAAAVAAAAARGHSGEGRASGRAIAPCRVTP